MNADALPPLLLRVPSLRERADDIPALAEQELAGLATASGDAPRRLSTAAAGELIRLLREGNLDLLRRIISGACQHVGSGGEIRAEDLPKIKAPELTPEARGKWRGQRDAVLRVLRTAGSVRRAAKEIEKRHRGAFIRTLHELGIVRADRRTSGRRRRSPPR